MTPKDCFFIWPDILKLILLKKTKQWEVSEKLLEKLENCLSHEFNVTHTFEDKLNLIEILIYEGMFNYTATKDSKSPNNKFKDYMEGIYSETFTLEQAFNTQDENLSISGFSDIDISSHGSKDFNTYESIISRINDYSVPVLLDKVKGGRMYPDFPNQIFIRKTLKSDSKYKYRWYTSSDVLRIHMNSGTNQSKLLIMNQSVIDDETVGLIF